jgi:hypothetical protein
MMLKWEMEKINGTRLVGKTRKTQFAMLASHSASIKLKD